MTEIDVTEVVEPCPTDVDVDQSGLDPSAMTDESTRLEPMLGVVLQYGSERPDVFGGYGLHWLDAGDASVFVSFTDDIAAHRAALEERVEYPDELIVCQAAANEADRRAIQAVLVDELAGRFTSIGAGGKSGAVSVGLNPTEETLAAELVERYGAAVEVRVGALEYPIDTAQSVCPQVLEPSFIDKLDVAVVDGGTELAPSSAGTVELIVELTNTGDTPIRFGSGNPTAVITDDQGRPRSADILGREDIGIDILLEPGEAERFDVVMSLAACDPDDGYLVGSGDHFVVVSLYNAQLQTTMNSDPLPVTITG